MHRNLYTEQFLCADTLPQRGLCADKLLHADAFTHRGFYANKKIHRSFYTPIFAQLHKDAFARTNKGTQAHLHRTFYTEKPLHRTTFTQRNFHTGKLWHRKNVLTDCTKKFLHTIFFTRRNFTQSSFCAQTLFRTEAFTDRSPMDSSFYTDAFAHRCLYTQKLLHTNLCTQHALTHSQFFHGEALLPLLDHLPFVFPLSSILRVYVICRNVYIYIYINIYIYMYTGFCINHSPYS